MNILFPIYQSEIEGIQNTYTESLWKKMHNQGDYDISLFRERCSSVRSNIVGFKKIYIKNPFKET